jgi:1-acyl-sn-glycerol-3-phosphate acyltransferase
MEDMSAAGDSSGRPASREGSLFLYNLWAWPFFAAHTLGSFTLAWGISWAGDAEKVFADHTARWARRNMTVGRFRLRVEGRTPEGGAVLVSNHRSFFDIPVVLAVVPPPVRFVARRGILGLPVAGAVLRRGGHILVDRESTPRNEAALARAALLARGGDRISFFPEGTRSRTGRIGPFRSGAFRVAAEAGAPVVPMVLAGTEAAFDSLWSPIRPSDIAVRFLPARTVSAAQAADPSWREALRHEMARAVADIAPGTGPRR